MGHAAEAEGLLESVVVADEVFLKGNLMHAGPPLRMVFDGLRLLVAVMRIPDKEEEEAARLEADVNETEAMLHSFSDAALL